MLVIALLYDLRPYDYYVQLTISSGWQIDINNHTHTEIQQRQILFSFGWIIRRSY